MTYLNDGTITVSLYPTYNTEQNAQLIINRQRSMGGTAVDYLWSSYDQFQLDVEYMSSSDGAQLNEWWENATQLTLMFDSTSYDVRIISQTQPVQRLMRPYPNEWKGSIFVGVL